MTPKTKNHFLSLTAFLTALAIVIPIMMPAKIVIPPASFTLASHVPIFIALFLSPLMTLIVIIGSSLGFLMAGFDIIIILRALSHLVFGISGALFLKKFPKILESPVKTTLFNIILGIIHALSEVFVCLLYFNSTVYPSGNIFYIIFVLVGLGTFIHSLIDFSIAKFIFNHLQKIR